MKQIPGILIFFFLLCSLLSAKPVISPVLMSAVIPGSGELVLNKTAKGIIFLSADLTAGYIFLRRNNETKWLEQSYKQFAYAKADVPKHRSAGYYQLIQKWRSSDEYNAFYEMLARNYFLILQYNPQGYDEYIASHHYSGEFAWNWDTAEDWKQYKRIRRSRQQKIMDKNLALGAMIANRLISTLDTALTIKAGKKTVIGTFSIQPDLISSGAILTCNLDF